MLCWLGFRSWDDEWRILVDAIACHRQALYPSSSTSWGIPTVHLLSMTLPMPCTHASDSQGASMISAGCGQVFFLKPGMYYYQLGIHTNQQLNLISLTLSSHPMWLFSLNRTKDFCMMTKAFELLEHAANHSPARAKVRFDAAVSWAREAHRREIGRASCRERVLVAV